MPGRHGCVLQAVLRVAVSPFYMNAHPGQLLLSLSSELRRPSFLELPCRVNTVGTFSRVFISNFVAIQGVFSLLTLSTVLGLHGVHVDSGCLGVAKRLCKVVVQNHPPSPRTPVLPCPLCWFCQTIWFLLIQELFEGVNFHFFLMITDVEHMLWGMLPILMSS